MSGTCTSCGAPAHGLVCGYCGSALVAATDPSRELEVLTEYHRLLSSVDAETRSAFLQNGYVPQSEAGLIEAGLRCIPMLDPWSGEGTVTPANDAAQRIEMIRARLAVTSGSRGSREACRQFDEAVARYRRRRRNVWLMVLGAILLVAIVVLASTGCWTLNA